MKRSLSMRAGKLLVGLAAVTALGMAHAAPVTFDVPLDGAHEVPPVQTAGSGSAKLSFDPDTRVVTWKMSFSGLSGPATMAHFHGPAAVGKNAGVKVPITQQGGAQLTSPVSGQATLSADDAKVFEAGEMYVNVHTKDHPDGEIRGQVVPPKGR